jgi:hypothetical protein
MYLGFCFVAILVVFIEVITIFAGELKTNSQFRQPTNPQNFRSQPKQNPGFCL